MNKMQKSVAAASAQKRAAERPTHLIEVVRSSNSFGTYWFVRVRAKNRRIVFNSETYNTHRAAMKAVAFFLREGLASVVDKEE